MLCAPGKNESSLRTDAHSPNLPLVIVFRKKFAKINESSTVTKICVAHISLELNLVNEADSKSALTSVSDSFKIPWLFSDRSTLLLPLQVFQPGAALGPVSRKYRIYFSGPKSHL